MKLYSKPRPKAPTEHLGYEGIFSQAEIQLLQFGETSSSKYAIAVKSWENNWKGLATFSNSPAEIRRLIYTTNAIESYNRGLRKVVKTKALFPNPRSSTQTALSGHPDHHSKFGVGSRPSLIRCKIVLMDT